MPFSKITLNGSTLMDVTGKTVTPGSMVLGITALKNDGTDITGTINLGAVTAIASDIKFGKVIVNSSGETITGILATIGAATLGTGTLG